jgi:hypothetical protein
MVAIIPWIYSALNYFLQSIFYLLVPLQEDEEEDVSSCWMTLGTEEDTLISKEEALDRIKWRNRFGRGCGPVVWQITDDWLSAFLNI